MSKMRVRTYNACENVNMKMMFGTITYWQWWLKLQDQLHPLLSSSEKKKNKLILF